MFLLWSKKADIDSDASDPHLNAFADRIVGGTVWITTASSQQTQHPVQAHHHASNHRHVPDPSPGTAGRLSLK